MSLRDHLPGAGKRRNDPEPPTHHRSKTCELRGCLCIRNGEHTGRGDIAIQNADGQPMGYVCQAGYDSRLKELGKDQLSTWKETGTVITPHQHTIAERRGMHELAELVSDFDRYAESMAHSQDDDDARSVD